MYNLDFKKEFIDIEFDQLLLRFNNHYINDSIYTDYKNKYLSNTKLNEISYNELVENILYLEREELTEHSPNKFIYFIYDKNKLYDLKRQCKTLVINQRNDLKFFLHYIDSLNERFIKDTRDTRDTISIKSNKSDGGSIKSNKSKKSYKSKKNKKTILSLFQK